MAIIGIDLGTTNSLAVAYKDDGYELIPNSFGEYLTPSVVSFDDKGNTYVGKIAKERLVTHNKNTASLFKRTMGSDIKRRLNHRDYTSEELSSFVVKQLIEDAKRYLNEDIEEVVISVPAYFNEFQRSATKRIGDLLNIKVERLINEPSAAALASHIGCDFDEAFIIFDFGGGTLDISVVDCFDNVVSICSIAGDNHLGGSDFDELIAKDICDKNNLNFDTLDSKQKDSLLLQAESIKIALSTSNIVNKSVFINQKEYAYSLDNKSLKDMAQSLFLRMRKVIAEAVNASGFEKGEIDKIILVGGSSHMPIVLDYLQELMNVPIFNIDDMDSIVAKGLGTYIGIKQRKESVKELVLTDICPFSLGVGTYNRNNPNKKLFSILIPKNSVLPASKKSIYYTVEKGQTEIRFGVYQGEGMYAEENTFLDEFLINVPKNLEDNEEVEVKFSYDINSLLCIDIKVLSTNITKRYFIGNNANNTQANEILNISMKLNLEPQISYIEEKMLRLLEESDPKRQLIIRNLYVDFERMLQAYSNNLRKKTRLIEQMNNIIVELELQNEYSPFFNDDDFDDEDDNDKGYMS